MQLVVAPNRLFFVEQEFKRLLVQALRSKKKHGNFQYYGPFFMLGLRFNRLHVNPSLLSKSSLFDIKWSIESLSTIHIWSYPG